MTSPRPSPYRVRAWRYSRWVYPLWGPLALWWNIRLYGHRMPPNHEDNWTSRLWKRTPYGKRKWDRRLERWNSRHRVRCG